MNFESRNPATGELLGVYREHDKAETDARLQRAWDGWRHWSRTPLHERIAFLTRLAELLEEPFSRSRNAPGTPATSPKRGRLISSHSPSPACRRRSSMNRWGRYSP